MATLEQIEQALRAADAAGNTDDARRLAQAYADTRAQQQPAAAAAPQKEVAAAADVDPVAPDPTQGMSGFDKFAAGMGKAFVDSARGLKQAGTEAVDFISGGGMASPVGIADRLVRGREANRFDNAVTRAAGRSLERQQGVIDEAKKLDAPLMHTGAGLAGNVTGYAAQTLLPGAALRGTAAARALLPATVAGNAALGGTIGALQPVATGDSRVAQTALGAGFGAGGAALAKGVGASVNALRSLASPALTSTERKAAQVLLREARDPQALQIPQPSAVPGVVRTLGEESMDPGVMGLEQAIRGPNRAIFEPIDLSNNSARVGAIGKFAGDDAAMASAEATRDATTAKLRDQAFSEGDQAANLAAQQGFTLQSNINGLRAQIQSAADSFSGRPSVQSALTDVSKALENAEPTVQGMYQVRQYIGDLLSGKAGADKQYAKAASRELIGMRDLIDDEIANVSPTFGRYLQSFKDLSKPINRMEVGQELISQRAGSAVPDLAGNTQLTPARFSNMANSLDQVAARATGFAKAKAKDILTPSDLKTISDVHEDLIRQFQRMKTTAGNSATSERNAVLDRVGKSVSTRLPFGIGSMIEALNRNADAAVQEKLAYLIANPAKARELLKTVTPKQRTAITQALVELRSTFPGTMSSDANATRNAQAPLEIDITGGTVGPAPTQQQLNALRGY